MKKRWGLLTAMAVAACLTLAFAPAPASAKAYKPKGPCKNSINQLLTAYNKNKDFRDLMDKAFEWQTQLPPEYPGGNRWIGANINDMAKFFGEWCEFLPQISGTTDNGLYYIQEFAWFYYRNAYGYNAVKLEPGKTIFQNFAKERGAWMDSPASTTYIAQWLKDPRIEKEDYILPDPKAPDGGFKSFNEFFARQLKPRTRPQTMPDRDYVITAPTDCIMNSIPQKISDGKTPIPTKGLQKLNIYQLLKGSKFAKEFIGGTALSCILMPNTYHHFHAPVGGKALEAVIVEQATNGIPEFPTWVAGGNVGYYGSDFSWFEEFKHGYFVVKTENYGLVALVPVGLNTISSIVYRDQFQKLLKAGPGGKAKPVEVKRGDDLGNFYYGGSLFIMIFQENRYGSDAIQVRLGNQIGVFDAPCKEPRKSKKEKGMKIPVCE